MLWPALCVTLLTLCWLGDGAALAVDYSEFYYGPDSEVHVMGDVLASSEFSLTGERIDVVFSDIEETGDVEKYAVLLEDDPDIAELQSAAVRLTGATLSFDTSGGNEDDNVAVAMWGFDEGLISLSEGSALSVDIASYMGYGIEVLGDFNATPTTAIRLDGGSTIEVSGSVDDPVTFPDSAPSRFAYGLYIPTWGGDVSLTLDHGSAINVETSAYAAGDTGTSYASSAGARLEGDVVTVALDNESTIRALATRNIASDGVTVANARTLRLGSISNSMIAVAGNSLISAQAFAEGGAAYAYLLETYGGGASELLLSDSIFSAAATADGYADALGAYFSQPEVRATLTRSTIDIDAISSSYGARASGFVGQSNSDVRLEMEAATIDVLAQTQGDFANATGVMIIGATNLDIDIADSTVDTFAQAAGGEAEAVGFSLVGSTTISSLVLDRSYILSSAVATDSDASVGEAYAAGLIIGVDTVAENISLVGSHLMSSAHAQTGEAVSYGVFVEDYYGGTPEVTLNLDAHSGILADWAVYTADGVVHLNNSGTLAGRLLVSDLTNNVGGRFMLLLDSDDLLIGEDGVGYFEDEDFYFSVADRAELADGTTFLVYPSDNLGIVSEGDSTSIALLSAGEGDWTLENLSLETPFDTPMIGLELTENAAGNQLIATATFLTPEQAGLSANATAAYEAAVDGGLFTPTSSPEEWSPNVSGAFVAGMAHTLRVSNMNIGNRLGMLSGMNSGMNSGDEIAASNGMWFSARFTDAEQDRRDGIEGFDADTDALSFGFDREFDNVILGFAYTRGNTDAKANDDSADFEMSDNLFSLYGHYDGGTWYSEAVISVGFGSVDSLRSVGSDDYAGDYDSTSYSALVESGCKISAAGWEIYPYLTLEYSSKDYDSYTETGGSLALHVRSKDYEVFTAGVGARLQKDFQRSWGIVTPEVSGQLAYDVKNDRIVSTANFVGGTTSFVAKGIEPAETSWDLGGALTIASLGEQSVSLRLGYDYAGRQDFEAHSFTGKVRFEF